MKYIIGVDGGGTKTAAALADINGNVIKVEYSSGCNPNDIGFENSMANILCTIEKLGAKKEDIAAVFCGIAGITAADHRPKANAWLKEQFPYSVTEALHDGINVIYSAFGETDGAIVICGTGSSCFMKSGSDIIRIGGYGKFDCAGNGYEIGKSAIAHSLKCVDGRDKKGVLYALVTEKAGGEPLETLAELISLPKKQIASYAPLVFDAYEKNDEYAVEILNHHLKYIGGLITRACEIYGGNIPVCIAGGIGTQELSINIIRRYIPEGVCVSPITAEPVYGAVAKAKCLLTQQ